MNEKRDGACFPEDDDSGERRMKNQRTEERAVPPLVQSYARYDCTLAAAGEEFLFRVALRPENQNTNNIVRGMVHRNEETERERKRKRDGVAHGLIGLFRAEGRKGSLSVGARLSAYQWYNGN